MKHIFLSLTTAVSLTMTAIDSKAIIGDTRAEAETSYGKPVGIYNGITVYSYGHWLIGQTFDKNGLVEAISYYDVSGGTPSDEETTNIAYGNLPSNSSHRQWTKIATTENSSIWLTSDSAFMLIKGLKQIGNSLICYMQIGKTEAVDAKN